nr:hypothetical protein Iba_chr06dCG9140 [Ipomoea batatas]
MGLFLSLPILIFRPSFNILFIGTCSKTDAYCPQPHTLKSRKERSPNAQTDIPFKENPCQKEQVNSTHSTTQPGDTQVINEKLIKHGGNLMQTVGGSLDYSSATLNALVQWTQADNNRVSSGLKPEGEKTVVRNRNSPPKGKPTGAAAVNPSRQTAPSSSSLGNISNSPSPAIPSRSRRSDRPVAAPNGNGRGGGRGGSQQPRRGKGRSSGKSGQASVAETSAAGAWRGTIANSGIFQFGGSQVPTSGLPTADPHANDVGFSSRCTPGEGGHQTSPPSNRSL